MKTNRIAHAPTGYAFAGIVVQRRSLIVMWALVAFVALTLSTPIAADSLPARVITSVIPSRPLPRDKRASRPLVFEANRGQADEEVQFVARGAGYTAFLTSTETVLRLGA